MGKTTHGVVNLCCGLMCFESAKRTFSRSAICFKFSAGKVPSFLQGAIAYQEKTAIIDRNGQYSYKELLSLSTKISQHLQSIHQLKGERIAFITPNDASYVISKWATWLCGAVSVPLCKSHPPGELSYILKNSKPSVVISTTQNSEMMQELSDEVGATHYAIPQDFMTTSSDVIDMNFEAALREDAMLIYTSGTTGRPKGAFWTHSALRKQVGMMLKSWEWSCDDRILHVLPLHHWHGIVNTLMCPLAIGATILMKEQFMPNEVWDHLLEKVENYPSITVFMGVPTIYVKLLQHFDHHLSDKSYEIAEKCRKIRLMVSGSAPLPKPVYQKWEHITSHNLLERYGMTEVGMSLTNPYQGKRLPGFVGLPFPGNEVKIVSEDDQNVIAHANSEKVVECYDSKEQHGELFVRGPIFKGYWGNKEATEEAFKDGWFKTGDTATFENGSFKIVGRTSVDIIKSGGYKIGALDIERQLLEHENIAEIAVLGVPDETWGQLVGALIVLKNPGQSMTLQSLKKWCTSHMPPYCVPKVLSIVTDIPKNAMGKVNKKELVKFFQ